MLETAEMRDGHAQAGVLAEHAPEAQRRADVIRNVGSGVGMDLNGSAACGGPVKDRTEIVPVDRVASVGGVDLDTEEGAFLHDALQFPERIGGTAAHINVRKAEQPAARAHGQQIVMYG